MPSIYPFRALRPSADKIEKVSAKSTDFPNKEDLIVEVQTNPFTFHHVTKSHLSYNGAYQEPEKFLPFAAQYIKQMKKRGVLLKENEDSFYVYEQTREDGRSFKGVIALCSIDDYRRNRIKKHEEIRPSRLKFLVELYKTTKVMGEPTLLAHAGKVSWDSMDLDLLYSFTSVDGKNHKISRIHTAKDIEDLQTQMSAIDNFYIADGHHRSASTAEFNDRVAALQNDKSMCFILEEDQIEIRPFHRLIKPSISIPHDKLIEELSLHFIITKSEKPLYNIEINREFGVYMKNQWYKLSLKKGTRLLDVEIIEEYIVKEIFGIAESRTDSQIAFYPHTSGVKEMCGLVDSKTFSLAITAKACTFSEVRLVSDENRTLPAKSTYIQPKLRAGMIIQEFEKVE